MKLFFKTIVLTSAIIFTSNLYANDQSKESTNNQDNNNQMQSNKSDESLKYKGHKELKEDGIFDAFFRHVVIVVGDGVNGKD